MGNCCGAARIAPHTEFVISLFGIDGAGKTSFLRALSGDFDFGKIVPTIGLEQKTFEGDNYNLTVWDLGGHPKFRSVWTRFFAELWGFVYVIDASDAGRFRESGQVLGSVRAHAMMAKKPFVIVANKVDCEQAVTIASLRETFALSEDVLVFETSCRTVTGGKCHEGVRNAIAGIVQVIKQRRAELSEQIAKDMEEQAIINRREREEKQKRANDRMDHGQ
jgi:small GTP-binding protein